MISELLLPKVRSPQVGPPKVWMPKVWLRGIILAALLVGCFIRFYDLGAKVYWEDETFTSLRVAGYLREELTDAYFQGQVIYPEDLRRFQAINDEKGLVDTVASLADDVHPPGYFALLRLWAERLGTSPATMRSFSAVLSLLLMPAIYGLSLELFREWPYRRTVAELAAALVAVSPYHIEMATEARMYSLWPVLTTLSGVLLLRALRCDRKLNWTLYSLAGMMTLYVHWFSVLVLFGHGLYVLISQGWRWSRLHWRYAWASAAMGAAILPWVAFVGQRLSNVYAQTTWTAREVSANAAAEGGWRVLSLLFQQWLRNAAFVFVHIQVWPLNSVAQNLAVWPVIVLIGLSIGFVLRRNSRPVWLFLVITAGIIYLPLAIADLTLGGSRSIVLRYLAPSFVAIEVMVAFYLVAHMVAHSPSVTPTTSPINTQLNTHLAEPSATLPAKPQKSFLAPAVIRSLALTAIIVALVGGSLSATFMKMAFHPTQQPLFQVATVLQETPRARLVSDTRPSLLMPLAHLLEKEFLAEGAADVQLQFTIKPRLPQIPIDQLNAEGRTVFLYAASGSLKEAVQAQGYRLVPVLGLENMQRLELKSK
jgi:uncharacterized membrane protein